MQICVVGTGYVGLVVGACLADTGNQIIGADVDTVKIEGLKKNILPIYEPGLEELVQRNLAAGRLSFTTDVPAAIAASSVVLIAVGTPSDEDGSADLRHVLAVADTIGRSLTREMVIVTKSTVPVGTAANVSACVAKHARFPFHIVSNPEFLKQGAAVEDFMKPDRVVLGVETDRARSIMADLYAPFVRTGSPIVFMDIASAEMTKYAANAMLATRVSFMNDIANLCERVGANIDHVRQGIGSDARIGPAFLFPGPGLGGSCFPKDVKALAKTARDQSARLRILEAVEAVNDDQKRRLGQKLRWALGDDLSGRHIAIWGLAFKPNTDDMREAPSLVLIEELLAAGARITAHDPVAMKEAERRMGSRIQYAASSYDALVDADALIVVTEWNEYRHPDFDRIKQALRQPLIIDGRNLYSLDRMTELGFTYHSIGRPSVS